MTDLADEARQADTDRALAAQERKLAEVRRDRDSARHALKASETERDQLAARLALVEQITDLDPRPPKWLTPKRKPTAHHATVTTILSDMHFDEVVNPDEMNGVNAYSREIATLRLRRYFDQIVTVTRTYTAGVTFDGVLLMLGGDGFSGNLHDLQETNEDSLPGSLLYWLEMLCGGVHMLADEFGHVHVAAVPGNHPRLSYKPRTKGRARDNFDWLLAQLVAREFRDDARVTFTIPDAFDLHLDVYGLTYRLEHGDQAKGGGGWIGATGPVMRRHQKMTTTTAAMDRPFDHLVVAHWHTLVWGNGFTINGSLKGYDEYAAVSGFGFEPPQQAMWLTTPERGITSHHPIFVADRKAEGW